MTREIIDTGPLLINTFACGKGNECVQFTPNARGSGRGCYVQMPRDKAIEMLAEALYLLTKQVEEDKINPPWWQQ